jgi:type IV pilus assembly protein PilE
MYQSNIHYLSLKKGFTLIEAMIVVAIIAIIAVVAIPSYRNYIVRSYRAKGIATLQANMLALEQYKTRTLAFPSTAQVNANSVAGYASTTVDTGSTQGYNITYSLSSGVATLTMTPTSALSNSETLCKSITLNSNEVQTAINSSNTDTTAACWNNNTNTTN